MKKLLHVFIIFFCGLLVGCGNELDLGAPPPQHFIKKSPAVRAQQLYGLNRYNVLGAFSVTVKNKARIINYSWYHSAKNSYTLKLSTPGDFYQAVLRNDSGNITYQRDSDRSVRISSLRGFMMTEFGWYIPLNNFYYWMRGVPIPFNLSRAQPVTQYDRYGHLLSLRQSGWQLTYQRYIQYGQYDLPTLITIVSPRGETVRVAIKEWRLYQGVSAQNTQGVLSGQDEQLLRSLPSRGN